MKAVIRNICLLSACLWAMSSSCVKDGLEPCDNKIRIVYDYNIDRVDKFHVQAKFVDIYAFESNSGLFAEKISAKGSPFTKDFEIDVPESLYGKEHDYLVWAGLDPGSYTFPSMRKGVSKIEDFSVQLDTYSAQAEGKKLEPLWHGTAGNISFGDKTERTEIISLTKNTNTFRIVFSFLDNGAIVQPYEPDDLEVGIYTANGWMSHDNSIADPKDRDIHYTPYFSQKEVDAGLVYELNTLRLMADREATLAVKDKKAGREVFRMPLISYLNLLRLVEESWIRTLQEYLDREDNFRMVLFIDVTNGNWVSFEILINDWVVRQQGSG